MESTLSIIIPAKNEEAFIGRCLESVRISLNKWGGTTEVIVVDNGSGDGTRAIAEAKGCLVIGEAQGNVARLRNIGAKRAKGDVIAFLDADCLVAPDWVGYCLVHFGDVTVAAVGTRAVPDVHNATWVERALQKLMAGARRPDFVQWLGTSNLFVRKEIFFAVGGFDERLRTAEDVDLCRRIGKDHKLRLEKRIDSIHLRESKTIRELFKREYWRGSSSVECFVRNRFPVSELPSVLVPFLNSLSFLSLLPAILLCPKMALFFSSLILSFPIFLIVKKGVAISAGLEVFQCYLVAFIYIFARSCALPQELMNFLMVSAKRRGRQKSPR